MKSWCSGVKYGKGLFPVLLVFLCWFANEPQAQQRERAAADAGRPAVVTIAFVGDLIFHRDLQRIAMADGARYRNLWSAADPIFQSADAVYGNLEGTLASTLTPSGERVADPGRHFNSPVYSAPDALKNFNYHFSLARDLRESGFRIVSTGNNHALDRGSAGVDQTIVWIILCTPRTWCLTQFLLLAHHVGALQTRRILASASDSLPSRRPEAPITARCFAPTAFSGQSVRTMGSDQMWGQTSKQ